MNIHELLQEVTYANKNLDAEYLAILTPQINAISAAYPNNSLTAKIVRLADEARSYVSNVGNYSINWDYEYQLLDMMTA